MKVSIDASCLLINPYSGLSEVVHNLLLKLPALDPNLKITLFLNYFRTLGNVDLQRYPQVAYNRFRFPRKAIELLWEMDRVPFDAFLSNADIFHSLYIRIPPVKKTKTILTIHDCRYLALPELYTEAEVKEYRRLLEMSLRRVDRIATVSEFTKGEVIKYFSFPEDRIKVVYNGFQPRLMDSKIKQKANAWFENNRLSQPYLLYVGSLEPRKNIERLVSAFAQCRNERRDFPKLVIAGVSPAIWFKSHISKRAMQLGIDDSVLVCGEVDNDILTGLIKNAFALCYLSLYEGFGFPPLDAMSLGVPVIAGMYSSIPEVTGCAAYLVNPTNIDEMANGLIEVVFNSHCRSTLINEGYEQVKKFSWEKAAEGYRDLYKAVL